MQVDISQAYRMIVAYIKDGLVPMLVGSPGCGKSDIIRQIAKDFGLYLIDIRLAQCDPIDINGFPHFNGNRASYAPMDTFPIEGDTIPEGYNGWLLFFDEFNSCPTSVQAAAYKVILDKMVGQYHLHKKVAMVAAGNLETDNAIVNPMSTAMQSRLVHIELGINHLAWCNEWAVNNNINHHITDYIKSKPGILFMFDPDHTDKTYPCPRTWEFANRILKSNSEDSIDLLPLLAGAITEGVAREFLIFRKIYNDLPKVEDILLNPNNIPVPEEPAIMYALTGSIAHNSTKDNLKNLMKYIIRLPPEFQTVCNREIIKRNPSMIKHPAIIGWMATNADIFF